MKSSYVMRARRFAAMVYPFIRNCSTIDEYNSAVARFNLVYHRNVRLAHGQTRIALITSDYVLKIDYGKKQGRFGGCVNECRAYQKAWNDGYAYLFARISPVMVNECVFYIMPRIEKIGAEFNDYSDACEFVTDEEREYLWDNFCDLHYNNFGWKNGHPVIVDYAFYLGDRVGDYPRDSSTSGWF